MDQENKILIGYKPELNYIDDYSSEIDNQLIDYDTNSYPYEDKDESINDLIENMDHIQSIIGTLPESISEKIEDIYDHIYDFVQDELNDKTLEKVPSKEEWNYVDEDNSNTNWDDISDDNITMDEFNPDTDWEDDDDFFPIEKEEHTEEEITEKEYVKNLIDLFEDYNTNLENILSNFFSNFMLASINKNTSEIKMLLDNILLSSSNVIDNAKHLLDSAVRESIVKNMKLNYFSTMFNAEETIKHLKQLKAMQELRLRYSKIDEVIGDTKTNQMNNNILIASKLIYDRKYEIAYENLYRYLTSSNKILEDTLQTYIQEMKSKQILIERNGIR